jgi:hypothetical protein
MRIRVIDELCPRKLRKYYFPLGGVNLLFILALVGLPSPDLYRRRKIVVPTNKAFV